VSSTTLPEAIRIGVFAGEAIRLAGLVSIFDQASAPGQPQLVPVVGALQELLSDPRLEFLVVDLNSSTGGLETLELVRRSRPGIRQIVIGPENQDELVLESIVAGARAYLASSAGPETVRQAIDVVVSGSIWAPRRLLSKLIDRLLLGGAPVSADTNVPSIVLTEREREVLELVVRARTNREIASLLEIEERTVKSYIARLMRKTGAETRIDLIMRAYHLSLVRRPRLEVPAEPN
jgi:DNA-binding NarL/FixJ family response regulator